MSAIEPLKPGRKPKPADERRSETLPIRLTRVEAERLRDTARLLGETRAELVRRVVLHEAQRVQAVYTKMNGE